MLIPWSARPYYRTANPALVRARFALPGAPPEPPDTRVVIAGLRRMVGKMLR